MVSVGQKKGSHEVEEMALIQMFVKKNEVIEDTSIMINEMMATQMLTMDAMLTDLLKVAGNVQMAHPIM